MAAKVHLRARMTFCIRAAPVSMCTIMRRT